MSDGYATDIARALATPGGHVSIGRGGYTLFYDNARLSGYDCELIKAQAVEAGLPMIDSRDVPFEIVAVLAVSGPMVAVNRVPDSRPWHGLAQAPLEFVAAAYRRAGADVRNIRESAAAEGWFDAHPPGPLANILADWLTYLRRVEVAHA